MTSAIKNLLEKTNLRLVMNTEVSTIHLDDNFSRAEEILTKKSIHYLPVVDYADKVVGLISQKYIYKAQSPRNIMKSGEMQINPNIIIDGDSYYIRESLDGFILKNIMMKNPPTLRPGDSVAQAIKLMDQRKIGCIPVVDKNKVIKGIFTKDDLINFLMVILTQT